MLIRVFFQRNAEKCRQSDAIPLVPFTYDDIMMLWGDPSVLPPKKVDLLTMISTRVTNVLENIDLELVQKLAVIEESNAYGMYFPVAHYESSTFEKNHPNVANLRQFAFGIYPISSLFNHSCSPNLYKIRKGLEYQFYALRDIPKGTEVCHSYIDLDKTTNQRRQDLQNNYGFACLCPRCIKGDDLNDPFMENYVCRKYGCGGLLISNVEHYPQIPVQPVTGKKKKKKQQNLIIEGRFCHKCGVLEDES